MSARFYLGRLANLCVTLIVASVVIFFMLAIAPGDVAAFMMGVDADLAAVEALRQELGLGGSLIDRYFGWVAGILTGDFGVSYTYRVPVSQLIGERLLVSLPLTIFAFTLSTLIAIAAATFSVFRHKQIGDVAVSGLTQLGIAIPNFWFAILLLAVFSTALGVFPAGGFPGWSAGPSAVGSLVLPAFALATPQAAILTRVLRTSLLETLSKDYIRTARAKGLSKAAALWKHALRNGIVPVLPLVALQFSFLIAGGIIVESVFYLPGLGRLVFQAITQRDLIVVQGVIVCLVFAVVLTMFVMDVLAAWLDPRLRKARS
jgi:peptide/nickel transport system permease protein